MIKQEKRETGEGVMIFQLYPALRRKLKIKNLEAAI